MHHMEDLYLNAGSKENASKRFIEVDMTKISHETLPMGAYNLGDFQKKWNNLLLILNSMQCQSQILDCVFFIKIGLMSMITVCMTNLVQSIRSNCEL